MNEATRDPGDDHIFAHPYLPTLELYIIAEAFLTSRTASIAETYYMYSDCAITYFPSTDHTGSLYIASNSALCSMHRGTVGVPSQTVLASRSR